MQQINTTGLTASQINATIFGHLGALPGADGQHYAFIVTNVRFGVKIKGFLAGFSGQLGTLPYVGVSYQLL